jgi:hypothetical protein
MKYFLLLFLLSISSINVFSQNNIALVNKIQGLLIFTDCQPISDYEVIGEVNTMMGNDNDLTNSGAQYQPVRDLLIKITKQVNYKAEGLILSLVNGGQDKGILIKFKDQNNMNHARVNQFQGVYIFVDNEPLNQYDFVGTIIPKNRPSSNQYTSIRELFLQKCVKDYGQAKGMMLKFVNGGTDIGDAIKFKN